MAVNEKGPEDSPAWRKVHGENDSPTVEACHVCRNTIVLWHCADGGCPWCAECGTGSKDSKKKEDG